MKKFVMATFILLFGLFFAPNSLSVFAQTEPENDICIETIYTDGILDYKNLEGISLLAVNENHIAYSNSGATVTLFNKETRTYTTVDGFENILSINFVDDKLLVADKNGISVLDTSNPTSQSSISGINFTSEIKAVDVYVDSHLVYIGYIDNDTFTLNEYTLTLEPKENPIKTLNNNKLKNTTDLAINDKNAYIICENSSVTTLYKLGYKETALSEKINNRPFTKIDTFYFDNQEYVVIFGLENLFLYKGTSLSNEQSPVTSRSDDPISKVRLQIANFDYYGDKIYVADRQDNGKIQEYFIEEKSENNNVTFALNSNKILICSNSKDKGRFDGASGIVLSGSSLIVTDKGNNSVHIIDTIQNTTTYIDTSVTGNEKLFEDPACPTLDEDLNLYFVSTNDENVSSIIKYTPSVTNDGSIAYSFAKKYSTTSTISSISSYKNVVYAIDYVNSKLLLITPNGIQEKCELAIETDENTKIVCLKSSNNLVIYSKQNLYLLSNIGDVIASTSTDELSSITCDYSHIYGLHNGSIKIFKIENNAEDETYSLNQIEGVESNKLDSLNDIYFDIATRIMFGFDAQRQCLVKFDFDKITAPFTFQDIASSTPLSSDPIALKLKNTRTVSWNTQKATQIIFEYPNQIGTPYNLDGSVTECIGIEETETEYRVLFKNNGILTTGYVNKQNTDIATVTPSQTNVITINKIVPIYKYPTLLKYNGSIIKVGELDHKTVLNVSSKYPISIDDKTFYKYEFEGQIGYIFNADIVKNDNKVISKVQANNATIKAIGVSKISIFNSTNEDEKEELIALENGDRVYVAEYSKDDKYTKVVYTDKNQKTTEGYILTEYLDMDKLDDTKVVLIIVICVSVVLLGVIITSYVVIRKKRK